MSMPTKFCRLLNLNTQLRSALRLQECQIHRWVRPYLIELKIRKDKELFKQVIPKLPNPRNTYLEWNYDAELFAFGKRLKEDFDLQLLRQAFTHRSYIIQEEMKQITLGIENPDIQIQDNRQLIEEGESFIRDYILAYLECALPKFPLEGVTAIRDHLVKPDFLANVASHLGVRDLVLCQEYPVTEDVLQNTFKAVVAALIRSSGAESGAHFVRDFVITLLNQKDVNEYWPIENPMEMLQDLLKKSGKNEPELRLIGESAKNTVLACYRVGIYIDKELFCAGFGENIKTAKEMAAREGLKIFFGTEEHMPPINFKMRGVPKEKIMAKFIQASS